MGKTTATPDAVTAIEQQWIDIFTADTHTDSGGNVKTWTPADLDQIIANHDAEHPAPVVIGHPQTDAPAYGWVHQLRRVGNTLQAKLKQVEQQFADMLVAGRFRNRSVSIGSVAGKLKLLHLGWLGAAAPAVPGLKPVAFNRDNGVTFEFAINPDDHNGWLIGRFSTIRRLFAGLRDAMIARDGLEAANDSVPTWALEDIDRDPPTDAYAHNDTASITQPTTPPNGGQPMPQDAKHAQPNQPAPAPTPPAANTTDTSDYAQRYAAQQEMIAKQQRELERLHLQHAEFTAQQQVAKLVSEGRITPAQSAGLAAFIARLPADEQSQFSVAGTNGQTAAVSPAAFFTAFLATLPARDFRREYAAPDGTERQDADDSLAIASKARAYQSQQFNAGNPISTVDAVNHVIAQQSAGGNQ